jgi:hypothetical protein
MLRQADRATLSLIRLSYYASVSGLLFNFYHEVRNESGRGVAGGYRNVKDRAEAEKASSPPPPLSRHVSCHMVIRQLDSLAFPAFRPSIIIPVIGA